MSRLLQKLLRFFTALFPKKKSQNLKPNALVIPDEIILTIMDRLSDFEHKKGFLQPMSLHKLAKKLKTNPKYLSRIINNHYEKNFSSYINDLRIAFLLKELPTNASLQKHTVKSLAKKLGFGNTESFSKAFKRHTGVNPSMYINNLHQ